MGLLLVMEQKSGCRHGRRLSTCWDCVSPLDQMESRRIWSDLEDVPDFTVTVEQAESEAKAGRIIQLHRAEFAGRRIMLPHSALWQITDIILSDSMDDEC